MRFIIQKITAIILFTALIVIFKSVSYLYGGETLKNLEREITKLVDSSKLSVVTVASKFSQEIYVEKENSILSFFKTEIEKKAVTYTNIGSGLLFDHEGHILTRSSIVLGSESNTVTLSDGKEYPAKFIGHDPETGFAVIKIENNQINPAKLGNSDFIHTGAFILIIGNSLGVFPSVVFGSINGLRKDGIIQISANLDPGNNGSPIFNTKGEVLGVVTARLNATEGVSESFVGYNFSQTILAYPINWVKRIAQDIIQFGYVRKGWLGVVGYHEGRKLKIREVINNSPAQKAGLIVGDVIVKFSGKEVNNISELARLVEYMHPGDTVSLEYLRAGKLLEVEIEIGEKSGYNVSDAKYLWKVPISSIQINKTLESTVQNYPLNWSNRTQILEMRIENLEKELAHLKKLLKSN